MAQIFFFSISKINNVQFCEILGYKKRYNNTFFSPLSFVPVFGSGMGKNQDPGSGINIPDLQHLLTLTIRMIICSWKLREKLINNKKMIFLNQLF
jgi:hypothetical protein